MRKKPKRTEAYYLQITFTHGAQYERINKYNVYRRDGWRCYLCKGKVQTSRLNADDQATIDHIKPLSLGGSHTYKNVRTCCRSCNLKKGSNA